MINICIYGNVQYHAYTVRIINGHNCLINYRLGNTWYFASQTKPSGEGATCSMYRRSSDWRLRLSDEGMGKQVKMEGVERSD
jgi:hypothetical protein